MTGEEFVVFPHVAGIVSAELGRIVNEQKVDIAIDYIRSTISKD